MTCRGVLYLSAAALLASASGSALAQKWSPEMHNARIAHHATANGIPQSLVRRVIYIESKGNPTLISKGNYGLMQIRLGTAKAMGYTGDADGLLNPDVNMTYAVKYLAGAYRAANGSEDGAIRNYQRGYYVSAKAKGFSPYEKPKAQLPAVALAATASALATAEMTMPPAPRSAIAAMMIPAQTPAEIVSARMPKLQAAAAAEIVDTNQSFDTKPSMAGTTTAMAPRDQRPVIPKPVKIEQQVAARPVAVKSDAPPVEAPKLGAAKIDIEKAEVLNIPMPRPAPQRAAPMLASVEPTAPAPEIKKVEPPKVEAASPVLAKRESRPEQQKPKAAAVPHAAPASKPAAVAAVPAAESADKPAASGDNKSLWSAFTNELAAARPNANAAPAGQAASASAAQPAPAAPAQKKSKKVENKKAEKESEPFNLLTYVKKKMAPDTKPEKKKAPQT